MSDSTSTQLHAMAPPPEQPSLAEPPKGQHPIFKGPSGGVERCLPLITLSNTNQVEGVPQIQFGKELGGAEHDSSAVGTSGRG